MNKIVSHPITDQAKEETKEKVFNKAEAIVEDIKDTA